MNDGLEEQGDIQRVLQSKAEISAHYDKIARVYDLLAERSERPMRELGLELLAATAGERLLEIGVGTGHSLLALARAVGPEGHVYGLDMSENMIRLTEELLQQESASDRAALHCGDAAELPYEDNSFDGLFMSFTLELFDTPEIPVVLGQCYRVLRPGGRLSVVGISKENPADPMVRVFEWTHRQFPNLLDCRPIHVRRALEAARFVIETSIVKRMWVPIEVVLGRKDSRQHATESVVAVAAGSE